MKTSGFDPPFMDIVKNRAKAILDAALGSHAWDHTKRVVLLCRRIGPEEGARMDILLTAAYLHDIGRQEEDLSGGRVCHAEKGASMALELLEDLDLSKDQTDGVIHCIRSHRFRGKNLPKTVEARVLFDADKLDSIGAVGIARAFLFAGEIGARLHNRADVKSTHAYTSEDTGFREYYFKLRHVLDQMQTAAGRRMALGRHRFMEAFFNRFLDELEGKG